MTSTCLGDDRLTERLDYYRERERRERAAAATAECPEARSAHLQLADLYEQIVRLGASGTPSLPEHLPTQPLIVLSNG